MDPTPSKSLLWNHSLYLLKIVRSRDLIIRFVIPILRTKVSRNVKDKELFRRESRTGLTIVKSVYFTGDLFSLLHKYYNSLDRYLTPTLSRLLNLKL